jgi:hypothetical protein
MRRSLPCRFVACHPQAAPTASRVPAAVELHYLMLGAASRRPGAAAWHQPLARGIQRRRSAASRPHLMLGAGRGAIPLDAASSKSTVSLGAA